jgi:hypothetical protein
VHGRRQGAGQSRQQLLHAVHRLNDVRARLTLNIEQHGGLFAALRADPRRELIVLHAVDDVRNIAESNRSAVFVSDDDRFVSVSGKNLVVRSDSERLPRPVEAAFRRIHVRLSENCSNIFQAEPEGGNRRRIHLHAHGRFLISLNRDKADAGDFANFLREQRVGEIVHAIQGQTIGRNRQRKDRRVGRIDLVVFRRVRQIWRQKSAGDIDRGLHVLRRNVDWAVENELQSDCRCTERAGGIHRRQSADLPKLPLERRSDRRDHHVCARAGIKCRHFDRWKINGRQR